MPALTLLPHQTLGASFGASRPWCLAYKEDARGNRLYAVADAHTGASYCRHGHLVADKAKLVGFLRKYGAENGYCLVCAPPTKKIKAEGKLSERQTYIKWALKVISATKKTDIKEIEEYDKDENKFNDLNRRLLEKIDVLTKRAARNYAEMLPRTIKANIVSQGHKLVKKLSEEVNPKMPVPEEGDLHTTVDRLFRLRRIKGLMKLYDNTGKTLLKEKIVHFFDNENNYAELLNLLEYFDLMDFVEDINEVIYYHNGDVLIIQSPDNMLIEGEEYVSLKSIIPWIYNSQSWIEYKKKYIKAHRFIRRNKIPESFGAQPESQDYKPSQYPDKISLKEILADYKKTVEKPSAPDVPPFVAAEGTIDVISGEEYERYATFLRDKNLLDVDLTSSKNLFQPHEVPIASQLLDHFVYTLQIPRPTTKDIIELYASLKADKQLDFSFAYTDIYNKPRTVEIGTAIKITISRLARIAGWKPARKKAPPSEEKTPMKKAPARELAESVFADLEERERNVMTEIPEDRVFFDPNYTIVGQGRKIIADVLAANPAALEAVIDPARSVGYAEHLRAIAAEISNTKGIPDSEITYADVIKYTSEFGDAMISNEYVLLVVYAVLNDYIEWLKKNKLPAKKTKRKIRKEVKKYVKSIKDLRAAWVETTPSDLPIPQDDNTLLYVVADYLDKRITGKRITGEIDDTPIPWKLGFFIDPQVDVNFFKQAVFKRGIDMFDDYFDEVINAVLAAQKSLDDYFAKIDDVYYFPLFLLFLSIKSGGKTKKDIYRDENIVNYLYNAHFVPLFNEKYAERAGFTLEPYVIDEDAALQFFGVLTDTILEYNREKEEVLAFGKGRSDNPLTYDEMLNAVKSMTKKVLMTELKQVALNKFARDIAVLDDNSRLIELRKYFAERKALEYNRLSVEDLFDSIQTSKKLNAMANQRAEQLIARPKEEIAELMINEDALQRKFDEDFEEDDEKDIMDIVAEEEEIDYAVILRDEFKIVDYDEVGSGVFVNRDKTRRLKFIEDKDEFEVQALVFKEFPTTIRPLELKTIDVDDVTYTIMISTNWTGSASLDDVSRMNWLLSWTGNNRVTDTPFLSSDIYKSYYATFDALGLESGSSIGVFDQLIDQINYIHDNGFIHFDLYPRNVLLDATEKYVSVIDFAKVTSFESARDPEFTDPVDDIVALFRAATQYGAAEFTEGINAKNTIRGTIMGRVRHMLDEKNGFINVWYIADYAILVRVLMRVYYSKKNLHNGDKDMALDDMLGVLDAIANRLRHADVFNNLFYMDVEEEEEESEAEEESEVKFEEESEAEEERMEFE